MNDPARPSNPTPAYRVLARKYRPASFEALIGQEAMVRTLANAIRSGRLAHAFILTGVRGVGKTTTAIGPISPLIESRIWVWWTVSGFHMLDGIRPAGP